MMTLLKCPYCDGQQNVLADAVVDDCRHCGRYFALCGMCHDAFQAPDGRGLKKKLYQGTLSRLDVLCENCQGPDKAAVDPPDTPSDSDRALLRDLRGKGPRAAPLITPREAPNTVSCERCGELALTHLCGGCGAVGGGQKIPPGLAVDFAETLKALEDLAVAAGRIVAVRGGGTIHDSGDLTELQASIERSRNLARGLRRVWRVGSGTL